MYLRDTGVLHTLLRIDSWEAFCLENILATCRRNVRAFFYRTAGGAELDLVLEFGQTRVAVEFKASTAPKPRRGFWSAIDDLKTDRNWIVAPVSEGFPLRNAQVTSLNGFLSDERNADFLRP